MEKHYTHIVSINLLTPCKLASKNKLTTIMEKTTKAFLLCIAAYFAVYATTTIIQFIFNTFIY